MKIIQHQREKIRELTEENEKLRTENTGLIQGQSKLIDQVMSLQRQKVILLLCVCSYIHTYVIMHYAMFVS